MYTIYKPQRRVPATHSFRPLVMITCGTTTRLVLHLQIKAALIQRTLRTTLGGRRTKKIVLKLVRRWLGKVSAVIVLIFCKENLRVYSFCSLLFYVLPAFPRKKIFCRSIRDTWYSLCVVMRMKRFIVTFHLTDTPFIIINRHTAEKKVIDSF